MFIGLFKVCVNKSLDYVPAKPTNWPISTKTPSTQPIKMAIRNGLPRFSRPIPPGILHDFQFECSLVNHNTLASVIGCVISAIGFLSQSVCL